VAAARRRLAAAPGVAQVSAATERSRDGRTARMSIVLSDDPYTATAFNRVPTLRSRVANLAPGVHGLVGGGSATQYDFNHATSRDLKVIVPISLLVIAIILGILLQAVVAPLVLIASVILSFFGTFGISILFFRYVFGEDGVDNSLPIFAFIFLIALGIDYTIFLMSRVREESRRHGTREGVLRALGATGPVITSAGIILAGTFSMLMTLPVWFMFNIGFMVAIGILLDTFVVRTIMVPAAVELVGDRIWWPSTARRGRGLVQEVPPTAERPREPVRIEG
jgi:RND superfamily putative drug exporter